MNRKVNLTRQELRKIIDEMVLKGIDDVKCVMKLDRIIVDAIASRACRDADVVVPFACQYLDQKLEERAKLRQKNSGPKSFTSPTDAGNGPGSEAVTVTVDAG